jgi:RsmE family RNA methyltransferase
MSAIPELFIADPNGAPLDATHCTIAIGPEGGFSEQESGVGAGLVSLGDTVLRAETAAISAAVLMSDHRRKRNQL